MNNIKFSGFFTVRGVEQQSEAARLVKLAQEACQNDNSAVSYSRDTGVLRLDVPDNEDNFIKKALNLDETYYTFSPRQ